MTLVNGSAGCGQGTRTDPLSSVWFSIRPTFPSSRSRKFRVIHQSRKMSSRFFAAGSDSDSETSSSSEDELSYDEKEEEEERFEDEDEDEDRDEDEDHDHDEGSSSGDEGPRRLTRDFFLRDRQASDESDEEDQKRVVKSARDKRWQEIEATSRLIENGGKINDWVVISNGTISPSFLR